MHVLYIYFYIYIQDACPLLLLHYYYYLQVVDECFTTYYNLDIDKIRMKIIRKQLQFEARKIAMYLCKVNNILIYTMLVL